MMSWILVRYQGCSQGYYNSDTYLVYDYASGVIGTANYDPFRRILSVNASYHGANITEEVYIANAPPPHIMLPNRFALSPLP